LFFYDDIVLAYGFHPNAKRKIIGRLNFIGIFIFNIVMLDSLWDGLGGGVISLIMIYIVSVRPLKEGFAPYWELNRI